MVMSVELSLSHLNTMSASGESDFDYNEDKINITAEFIENQERIWKGCEERFLNGDNTDDEGWQSEALAVISDVKKFVKQIEISKSLPCDQNGVYMNLQTIEGVCLTIELSCAGFRVCSHQFDTLPGHPVDGASSLIPSDNPASTESVELNVYYETPYALLNTISPAYRNSFSNELASRLQALCK